MSFSSKQLLPPSFYLIKAFHLQQIQWHALVNRWKTSCLQESLVWLFCILFVTDCHYATVFEPTCVFKVHIYIYIYMISNK